jgi:hypothetical protein
MSHGSYCLHSAVEELAQTIAEYAAKLVVNDNGLYVFCGHCLGYFDVSVVAVINSHGETLMTFKCRLGSCAQAVISPRQNNKPFGEVLNMDTRSDNRHAVDHER